MKETGKSLTKIANAQHWVEWPNTTATIVDILKNHDWKAFWDRYGMSIRTYVKGRIKKKHLKENTEYYLGAILEKINKRVKSFNWGGGIQFRGCLMKWIDWAIYEESRDSALIRRPANPPPPSPPVEFSLQQLSLYKQIFKLCLDLPWAPKDRIIVRLWEDLFMAEAENRDVKNEKLKEALEKQPKTDKRGRKSKPRHGKIIAQCTNCNEAKVSQVHTLLGMQFLEFMRQYRHDQIWFANKKDYSIPLEFRRSAMMRLSGGRTNGN